MKQKVQKQLHPLFSNKTFPPDSSSFVIQFHFPLDAKGLKAFVRSPWSHLSALIERPEGQIIQIHSESNTLILENKKICGFRRQNMDQWDCVVQDGLAMDKGCRAKWTSPRVWSSGGTLMSHLVSTQSPSWLRWTCLSACTGVQQGSVRCYRNVCRLDSLKMMVSKLPICDTS